jgi:hypothetical protein
MCGRKKAIRSLLMATTFLSVLAALGCGTYSPVAPSNTPTMPGVDNPEFATLLSASKGSEAVLRSSVASAIISAEKGGVVSNEYFSLYFPAGALERDTEISIEMPEFPKAVVRLGPHGIKFSDAVILSLPIETIAASGGSFDILWFDEDAGVWRSIAGYEEAGTVKAKLEHFSEYGITPD